MAGPSVKEDLKITELPEVLTKPSDGWLVIVVPDTNGLDTTSKIRLSVLVP